MRGILTHNLAVMKQFNYFAAWATYIERLQQSPLHVKTRPVYNKQEDIIKQEEEEEEEEEKKKKRVWGRDMDK